MSKGVNDFLQKPFNTSEFVTRIQNILARKTKWNSNHKDALFINNKDVLDDVEKSVLQKIENLIISKIDDPNLSVRELAEEIAVSERKFYRMIKKLTDSTPYEYIKEVRLVYANELITEKKMNSSSEVAKSIGMSNVSHFNEQFKKRFGKKPVEII